MTIRPMAIGTLLGGWAVWLTACAMPAAPTLTPAPTAIQTPAPRAAEPTVAVPPAPAAPPSPASVALLAPPSPAPATLARREGSYEGGLYRIEVPPDWNGGLVMYAHGIQHDRISVSDPPIS